MANHMTCKLSYGDETRRFKVNTDGITYHTIHSRAEALFGLDPTKFKLQYKDDEEDVITMATDEEMAEAVMLAIESTPSILRINVKMDAPPPPAAAATAAVLTTAQASPPPHTEPTAERPGDLTDVFRKIQEQLPGVVGSMPNGAAPDLSNLFKSVGESLPKFVESLPDCVRKQIGNAELDVAATVAANAADNLATVFGNDKRPSVSFSVDGRGYGDTNVHPGVTCDKSGMCPIVGPRYNLKGHDYDLCQAEFHKLEPVEQAKFVKIDPPLFHGTKSHHGVTCDKSGMCPIVGPRYNLKGHNYDLCQAEFDKLEPAEQAKFVKIEAPWRPKGYGWSGPRHCAWGPRQAHFGGCPKLAARFVSDVSIFDGTQMAPGTKFTKIWRLKNAGETPWPVGTKILFVGGDLMDADMTVQFSDPTKVVMPGEEVEVAVDMTAPPELGRYLGYWRLVGPHGRRRFGQRIWCHIQVVDQAGADAPLDPKAVEAEISSLMAKAKEDDPDADDDANDPEPSASSAVAEFATLAVEGLAGAVSEPPPEAAKSSSLASSVVSIRHEDAAPAEGEPTEEAAKEAVTDAAEKALAEGEVPAVAHLEEAKAHEDNAPQFENGVATQLLTMGFEPKSVELVLEKHFGVTPLSEMLEACTLDLMQLSEWDSMLSDLEEMGFSDREKNTRLMIKNDGSVKRTVKDLVTM